jgi:hypothetical protein
MKMKKKSVFTLVPAIALFFALTLIGCPQPGGGGSGSGGSKTPTTNSSAKTLVITNFDVSNYFPPAGALGLYPVGTSKESVKNKTASSVAGAYRVNPDITFSGSTFTIPLHTIGHNPPPWTGSGKYDVYVIDNFTSAPTKYAFLTIDFSEATTTVDWSKFTKGTF